MRSIEEVRRSIAELEIIPLVPMPDDPTESKKFKRMYKQAQKKVVKLRKVESILLSGLKEDSLLRQKREQEVLEQNLEDGFESWVKFNESTLKSQGKYRKDFKKLYEAEVELPKIRQQIEILNYVLAG